jgi:hypothetical protein
MAGTSDEYLAYEGEGVSPRLSARQRARRCRWREKIAHQVRAIFGLDEFAQLSENPDRPDPDTQGLGILHRPLDKLEELRNVVGHPTFGFGRSDGEGAEKVVDHLKRYLAVRGGGRGRVGEDPGEQRRPGEPGELRMGDGGDEAGEGETKLVLVEVRGLGSAVGELPG